VSLNDVPTGINLTVPGTGESAAADADGQVVLPIGAESALKLELVNNSGTAIPLAVGDNASTFGVFLPDQFFTADQLRAVRVTADGWAGFTDPPAMAITITCTRAATWAADATLAFTLTGVVSGGPPGFATIRVVPSNLDGDVAIELSASLTVAAPPAEGNAALSDVLQVTLDSQGTVLRTRDPNDPLANTLYLTLKNTGAAALSTGTTRAGNPQVLVSFVYGQTAGSLAPATYDPAARPSASSAWNITVGVDSAQSPWTAANPRPDSEESLPRWALAPSTNNLQILGPADGNQANVTFAFSGLVTANPAGHTQMLVLCTGFAQDAQRRYDDHLFVLDVVKVEAPPTRGLLSFSGEDPVIPVTDPKTPVDIPLRWSMFDVASVRLVTSSPAIAPVRVPYDLPPKPVAYDKTTLKMQPPQTSEALFVTLQAFDGGGGYLNSQQFTAYLQVSYVIDPEGNLYPVGLFGNTLWMLENYRCRTDGSYLYGEESGDEATYGRLYPAGVKPPDGWSMPGVADWTALFASFADTSDKSAAYEALIAGGRSGFNAQLGGQRGGSGGYDWQYQDGFYWAAGGRECAQFSGSGARVGTLECDPKSALSVRFIRHA
jgi:uncharacterized protein (TIGR02145 family)